MSTIQPRGLDSGDEELRTVRVGTSISHGKDTLKMIDINNNNKIGEGGSNTYRTGMSQLEVFIFESVTIDRLTTSTIKIGEITTLNHEILNNTVEDRVLVTITVLASSQLFKVFNSLGDTLYNQLSFRNLFSSVKYI